jgi:hypothetical protein
MALNPNIALAARGVELQDPLAQYGRVMAIQQAGNQNQLAQYQLGAAQRVEARDIARTNALAGAGSDETAVANALLKSGDIPAYSAFVKAVEDRKTQRLTQQKTQGEISAQPLAMQKAENELFDTSMKQIRNSWGSVRTPEDAMAIHDATHRDPVINKRLQAFGITEQMGRQQIIDAAQDPARFAAFVQKAQLGAEKFMEMNKPQLSTKDTGNVLIDRTFQPLTGQITEVSRTPKMMVPGEQERIDISRGQLRTSQGQLNLAQQKFAFEKANPTMSIQEDPSGLLAVNTRTGVATPVVYGPNGIQAAPVAPAAAPGAGMPGPRLPAPTTQAIPGMTSVLDQAAAPARMPMPAVDGTRAPGTPVRGTKDAPAKFNDTDMQLAGLAGSLKEFKDEVGKKLATGAKFLPAGQDTARMQAKYTSLLMGVKDLYTLGALAGPDMSIIESQLTNPASWAGKMTSQKGFEEQIKVIEDMLKRTAGSLENTYSRQPKATKKALESLGTGLPGSSANNPLGLPGL